MRRVYWNMALAVMAGSIRGVLSLGAALLIKMIADMAAGSSGKEMDIFTYSMIAGTYYFIYMFVYWSGRKIEIRTLVNLRTWMKTQLFTGLLWRKNTAHDKERIGDILSKFQYQTDLVETAYYESLIALLSDLFVIFISLSAILYLQSGMAAGVLFLLAIYLLLTRGMNKRLERLQQLEAEANERESNEVMTMVKGYYTAKDYGQEEYFLNRYGQKTEEYAKASFRYSYFYNILTMIYTGLEPLLTLFVILAGAVMLEHEMAGVTVGGILSVTQLAANMIGPVGRIGSACTKIFGTRKLRREMKKYIASGEQGKNDWMEEEQPLEPLRGLRLCDVSFSYGEKMVFDRMTLCFEAGKKYAVIGKSGEGKTTLLKLLLKQLEPQMGNFYWNDRPYADMKTGSLLRKIGYVSQNPMIFHKSIKDNIAVNDCNPERLRRAMQTGNVSGFENGRMRSEDLENLWAADLSEGEKKRVAYARALYKECEVLILDEFTSSLQRELAVKMESEILAKSKQLVINVTHSLSEEEMGWYDKIYEIRDGRMIEHAVSG